MSRGNSVYRMSHGAVGGIGEQLRCRGKAADQSSAGTVRVTLVPIFFSSSMRTSSVLRRTRQLPRSARVSAQSRPHPGPRIRLFR